ncbi:hypothetical protein J6590_002851 [Homalodisca vitripennis]|nr:hypothetical protein J6590_002851 [Homalodisca vitripennis]
MGTWTCGRGEEQETPEFLKLSDEDLVVGVADTALRANGVHARLVSVENEMKLHSAIWGWYGRHSELQCTTVGIPPDSTQPSRRTPFTRIVVITELFYSSSATYLWGRILAVSLSAGKLVRRYCTA